MNNLLDNLPAVLMGGIAALAFYWLLTNGGYG